ncbi:MAG: tetratricopeptide repeat protein [Ignavibacteriaceae bacterium]
MKSKTLFIYLSIFIAAVLALLFFINHDENLPKDESEYVHDGNFVYLNTAKNVKFVGTDSCYECHKTSYHDFTNTEMHHSFMKLNASNIIETYPQQKPVYDPKKNYYYEMLKKDDKFYQREYRLDKKGKVIFDRMLEAQYTIGSGNNLRMYFYDENGMFYQLPLTWNSHKKSWDLSPGYRETENLRFSRFVTNRCMACHNSYQTEKANSIDRYEKPYEIGIGCERCHGPGELHLKEMNSIKYEKSLPKNYKTIINPRKLSPQRQLSVCMQCHLQGKGWAINKKDGWFDFHAGELLETNRSVFFPEHTAKEVIEVGDSPHRLMLSQCFKKSNGNLTCITCHNPHHSIKSFTIEHYNSKCMSCHSINDLNKNKFEHKHTEADNCVSCHMNKTGSDNTLHGVSLTDHWIRVDANKTKIDWASIRTAPENRPLVELAADVNNNDDDESLIKKGIAYIDFFKEFDNRIAYIDSAVYNLEEGLKIKVSAQGYYYLGEAYLILSKNDKAIESLKKCVKIDPKYAEAFYKLGEAFNENNEIDDAVKAYQDALALKQNEPIFLESLGNALVEKKNYSEAVKMFEKSIMIDNQNPYTFFTLGNIYIMQFNQPQKALEYYKQAAALDPDVEDVFLNLGNTYALLQEYQKSIEQYKLEIANRPNSASAYVNLGRVYQLLNKKSEAKSALQKALQIDPALAIAKEYLNQLK